MRVGYCSFTATRTTANTTSVPGDKIRSLSVAVGTSTRNSRLKSENSVSLHIPKVCKLEQPSFVSTLSKCDISRRNRSVKASGPHAPSAMALDTSCLRPRQHRCGRPCSRTKTIGKRRTSRPTLNVLLRLSSVLRCLRQSCDQLPRLLDQGYPLDGALSQTAVPPASVASTRVAANCPCCWIKVAPSAAPSATPGPGAPPPPPPLLSLPRWWWWSPPPTFLLTPPRSLFPRSRLSLRDCFSRLSSDNSPSCMRPENEVGGLVGSHQQGSGEGKGRGGPPLSGNGRTIHASPGRFH